MKRLSLTLCLLVALTASSWSTLVVDNTVPLSDNHRVIYEMNVYDFTSQGTFAAAEQRLPELRKLGIDIVWLMPIHPRGVKGKIGSLGSPYAVRDYTAVNSAHGSLSDLQSFVNTAHELGMKVWLDWVANHTALDHVWVSSHPEYYERVNGVIQHPNNYGDVYQLDFSNEEMKEAMIDAMRYWVNEADIDGFRCDYASSPKIGVSFWQQAITGVQTNDRGKHVEFLAEADFTSWDCDQALYNAGFEYDYAWGFADNIKSVGEGTSITAIKNAASSMITTLNSKYRSMNRMSFLTNHDDIGDNFCCNYMTNCGSNVPPLTVVYFTFVGMPLIYNGQEIGSKKILNYFNRNTISWSSVDTKIANTFRALIALKHTLPALADGTGDERASTRIITTNSSTVFAFEKKKGDDRVVVVISLNENPIDVKLNNVSAGTYTRLLDSETVTSEFATTPVELSSSPTIHLEAKGYHIYANAADYDTYHLYVDNQTSWQQFDLYAWGDCEFFGSWPGATSAPTVTKGDKAYLDYSYTVSAGQQAMTMNLIFHNNVGEGKPGDYRCLIDLRQTGDYYLTITDSGYDVSTDVESVAAPVPNPAKLLHDGQLLIITNGHIFNAQGLRLR